MSKKLFILFVSIVLINSAIAQSVPFSFSGSTTNWDTKQDEYGVTIYFIQSGRTLSRVLSLQNGSYSITAKVNPEKPFELYFAKPGLITKKVLFDFKDLDYKKILRNNPRGDFQIKSVGMLDVSLFSPKTGVDFSFLKTEYIAEFFWNGSMAEIDKAKFDQMEIRIKKLLEEAEKNKKFNEFVSKGDKDVNSKKYESAINNYDSALVIKSNQAVIKKKENAQNALNNLNELNKLDSQISNLISKGDSLSKLGEFDNAKSAYEKALGLDEKNSEISSKLNSTNKIIEENVNLKTYKEKFAEAKKTEENKKYDEAIAKYKECIALVPKNKSIIVNEIAKVLNIKKRLASEKDANDLIQVGDSKMNGVSPDYISAIKDYKNAKKLLKKYPDSKVIKTANEKIEHVLDMQKSSAVEIYNNQIKKAQEAVDKGPEFYKTAKNILYSAPMKRRINEPESKMLLKKISVNEDFIKKRKNVYAIIKKKDNNKSLKELNKLSFFANKNSDLISKINIDNLTKSADSLREIISSPSNITNNNSVKDTITPVKNSIQLEDLGTPVDAEKDINFLNTTDLIKTKIVYDKIDNDLNAIENEEIYKSNKNLYELQSNEKRINKIKESSEVKEETLMLLFNENLKNRIKQQDEVEINRTKKNENIKAAVTENSNKINETAELIEKNKLARTYKIINLLDSTDLANKNIVVSEDEKNLKYLVKIYNNDLKNDSLMEFIIDENQNKSSKNLNLLKDNEKRRDTISIQVQKIPLEPNYLKNSKGEQYKIGLTEEIFKRGPAGMENEKITRRVIVDENYHGDIYISYESLNNETTYTKNNKLISRDVWITNTQKAKLVKN